jgi:DNA-3-methyladenine glycosylase
VRIGQPQKWNSAIIAVLVEREQPDLPTADKIPPMPRLLQRFFARPTVQVARDLLGQKLVRIWNGRRLSGLITETEAYVGEADLACHARAGKTGRTAVMYGPPGCAYVYFTYGHHWMLNVVTEREGFPAAVLIRALRPVDGLEVMRRRRQQPDRILTNGPGKLAQALAIDGALNGARLFGRGAALFIDSMPATPAAKIACGPRVGIDGVPEPWLSMAWNFKMQ